MPAAMERRLKHEASKKGLKGDRKDKYVYGTMRKTGWKPNREKKMSSIDNRIVRLRSINSKLSEVQFDQDDDDKKKLGLLKTGLAAGAGATAAAGGLYATGAMAGKGGMGVRGTLGLIGQNLKDAGNGGLTEAGRVISRGARVASVSGRRLLQKAMAMFSVPQNREERLVRLKAKVSGLVQLDADSDAVNQAIRDREKRKRHLLLKAAGVGTVGAGGLAAMNPNVRSLVRGAARQFRKA